ncbi:MAG: hypothetical protein OEW04_02185 [Nitrospirota bacterium]|nr:hypothetical protein [Nitrospirota bacterium]
MKSKDYFILGCKLFGIYCLVLGVPTLLTTIPTFVQTQMDEDYRRIMMATKIATRLLPVIFILGGFYLIRGGARLYHFAYPDENENRNQIEEKLLLFLKMLGIYLVISYFPDLLKTISSYIAYSNAPKIFNLMQEQQYTYVNAASSIWGVGVGLYLFRGGKFIVSMAMKSLPEGHNHISEENNG